MDTQLFRDRHVNNLYINQDARIIIEPVFQLLRDRFETADELLNRLPYHNTQHTLGVMTKATKIGRAMGLSERQLLLVQIAAGYHDSIQAWHKTEKADGIILRQRIAGYNETVSANEAADSILSSGITFTAEEKGLISLAIMGTIPGWNSEHKTVYQPFLIPGCNAVIRAVALADLGSAGMDPQGFLEDGLNLFAEENLDIMMTLDGATESTDLPYNRRKQYTERFVSWLESQAGFARGRRALLAYEVNGIDMGPDARNAVMDLFTRFDESIRLADEAVLEAEGTPFSSLMRRLHPRAFSGEG